MSLAIEDISHQLGISVLTVFKALNDYRDVAQETRERVLTAVHALDYHPSTAARNFQRGCSERIVILIHKPVPY